MLLQVVVALICVVAAALQADETTEPLRPYVDPDAYAVYSALLPRRESYRFAKGRLVIKAETISKPFVGTPAENLSEEALVKYKDAVDDFLRVNSSQWLIQQDIRSDKPYTLLPSAIISGYFAEGGGWWGSFYARYPESGGFIEMSAVGFNKDKTVGLVYMGSACGDLCGEWSYTVVEKKDGKWVPVKGVITKFTVS